MFSQGSADGIKTVNKLTDGKLVTFCCWSVIRAKCNSEPCERSRIVDMRLFIDESRCPGCVFFKDTQMRVKIMVVPATDFPGKRKKNPHCDYTEMNL